MASPQLDDGYTCIAHELLEQFCKVNLSPYESRVMWYLLRKTYGYKQKMDEIPTSQFSEATGLDKRNAGRAVRSLKEKNMIATDGKRIGLQKDYDKWCVSPKTRNVSVSAETLNRHQQRHGNGVSRDTSKDIKIKDSSAHRKRREHADTDPRVKTLLATFVDKYRARVGASYVVVAGKDPALLKRLLTCGHDVSAIDATMDRYFADDFYSKTGFDVGGFAKAFNRLNSAGARKKHNYEGDTFPPL